MGSPAFFRRSLLAYAVLGVLFGLATNPAWALGPGVPPVIKGVAAYVATNGSNPPQLIASVEVEIPGGNVPINVLSVTVSVPGGGTFGVPLDRLDLAPEQGYFLNLTQAGVVGFPAGTYTFQVTDTAGGISAATDTLGATAGLAAPTGTTVSGLTPVPAANGVVNLLNLATNPTPTISWTPVPGAATHRVRVRGGFGDQDLFARYTGNGTTSTMTLPAGVMAPGRRYFVRVEAYDHVNGFGCSVFPLTCADANARSRQEIEVVTQGPEVFLTFPGGTYANGQSLDVTARIYNSGPAVTVNGEVWIGLPTGGVIPILNVDDVVIPTSTADPNNDFYNGPLGFTHTFTGSEPIGNYVVGLRLTDPATRETVALATRSLYFADPTFIQPSPNGSRRKTKSANGEIEDESHDLTARISLPSNDSLVRGNVPIFGVAYGMAFSEYRVEYGEGRAPTNWIVIESSASPRTKDVAPDDLEASGDVTIHGNLATWDTGLKSYVYLPSHPKDHPIDLKGVYTVRLVAIGRDGRRAEDRVTVEVADVVPNAWGGSVVSRDGKVRLRVGEQSLMDSFRLLSIKPAQNPPTPVPQGRQLVGGIYELREAGERFTKDATLEIECSAEECVWSSMSQIGIYSYDPRQERWEHLQSVRAESGKTVSAKIQHVRPYYALMRSQVIGEGSILEDSLSPMPRIPKGMSEGMFLVRETFEDGMSEWSNRDGNAGGEVALDADATFDGSRALMITKVSEDGNFAVNVRRSPFDAREYPIIEFDYRVPPGVKTNFLVKVSGRWYEVGFTGNHKELRNKRVNIAKVGQIEGVAADDQWHAARFNLYEMLRTKTGHTRVDEMIMADWDVPGYMKLQFGRNRKGATYYIDNFTIAREMDGGLRQESGAILVDDFNKKKATNAVGGATTHFVDGEGGRVELMFGSGKDAVGRGHALGLSYDLPHTDSFAGYVSNLRNVDLRGYQGLTFLLKGTEAVEDLLVGLRDRAGNERKVQLSKYLRGGVTPRWQRVSIPLVAFSHALDWARIDSLSFSFEHGVHARGTVLLDDIEFHKNMRSLVVDAFDESSRNNLLGGRQWTFASGAAAISSGHATDGSNGFYRLSYGGNIGTVRAYGTEIFTYAGWTTELGGMDCSQCGTLSFRIRGADGGERPNIYLDDGNFRWGLNVATYAPVTREWQTVTIPLQDFAEYGVDLTHLAELQVVFEWEKMSGTVYLDGILFGPPSP